MQRRRCIGDIARLGHATGVRGINLHALEQAELGGRRVPL